MVSEYIKPMVSEDMVLYRFMCSEMALEWVFQIVVNHGWTMTKTSSRNNDVA